MSDRKSVAIDNLIDTFLAMKPAARVIAAGRLQAVLANIDVRLEEAWQCEDLGSSLLRLHKAHEAEALDV